MRKIIFQMLLLTVLLAVFICVLPVRGYADSAATSTTFSDAYMDIPMVKEAQQARVVNSDIAKYLSSSENSIDKKAAVINALYNSMVWNDNSTQNPQLYSKMVFNKSIKKLELDKLSGDDLFCLGYLTLLEDYFNPQNALDLLQRAKDKNPDSFTVSIVLALDKAQIAMDSDWYETYMVVKQVMDDKNLKQDMRPDAVKIITDYMYSYGSYAPPQAIISDKLGKRISGAVVLSIGNPKGYVNGDWSSIDFSNKDVYPYIDGGRTMVPVRFIAESLGAKVSWDDELSVIEIALNGKTVKMAIGENIIYIDGAKQEIDVPAKIVNGRAFVPLRALTEALGKKVFWDDRGIIIISDNDEIINLETDKNLIDELAEKFEY